MKADLVCKWDEQFNVYFVIPSTEAGQSWIKAYKGIRTSIGITIPKSLFEKCYDNMLEIGLIVERYDSKQAWDKAMN